MLSRTANVDTVWIKKIRSKGSHRSGLVIGLVSMIVVLGGSWSAWAKSSGNLDDPETVIRMIVKANAQMDMKTLEVHMAADEDTVGYTIGGRKYIGWKDVKQAFEEEFSMLSGLTIDILNLKVWQKGEVAWFAMEIDYNREVQTADGPKKKTWPLRDTGVLSRREGKWMLVNWHESMREPIKPLAVEREVQPSKTEENPIKVNLTGQWEIQEEDKAYQVTLDGTGNGPYTWQEGRLQTEKVVDRLWSGTWHQKGNDREGGFEVLLSEDGKTADGVWWYSRVGTQKNIPPREWGGTYKIKRLSPLPSP
ncbi:MAG: nuclear transport factor 2 family protein [Nitrospirota bacterium]|nr:nuclear transport factor 2 family protein [Nitrospirota bacterium]MDH5585835.1 nuclear transport factor 2 family protein [Nitrospirota bacterium]